MERIQRRPQVVEVASDLANSLEVDSLVEYLQQCGGNQFEDEYFVDGSGDSSHQALPPIGYQQQQQQPLDRNDSPSVQVQWEKSWDQNLEVATVGSSSFVAPSATASPGFASSKYQTASVRAAAGKAPKNKPFLAKLTSVGKLVRLLCTECGEDKSIIYKTKFTLKV